MIKYVYREEVSTLLDLTYIEDVIESAEVGKEDDGMDTVKQVQPLFSPRFLVTHVVNTKDHLFDGKSNLYHSRGFNTG